MGLLYLSVALHRVLPGQDGEQAQEHSLPALNA